MSSSVCPSFTCSPSVVALHEECKNEKLCLLFSVKWLELAAKMKLAVEASKENVRMETTEGEQVKEGQREEDMAEHTPVFETTTELGSGENEQTKDQTVSTSK